MHYAHFDAEVERRAMDLYAEHLPGWEVIGIDATTVIVQRGSLRCVSINIPWMEDHFDPPQVYVPRYAERRSRQPAFA